MFTASTVVFAGRVPSALSPVPAGVTTAIFQVESGIAILPAPLIVPRPTPLAKIPPAMMYASRDPCAVETESRNAFSTTSHGPAFNACRWGRKLLREKVVLLSASLDVQS